jgi:hypothetical protein
VAPVSGRPTSTATSSPTTTRCRSPTSSAPDNWRDYGALILARFKVRPSGVTEVVNNEHQLICSQLVDLAYKKAGIHLFNDGRESGDVTPGDLADLITRHRWAA